MNRAVEWSLAEVGRKEREEGNMEREREREECRVEKENKEERRKRDEGDTRPIKR